MRLKEFLAVGRSFGASPKDKSPYGMRKDVLLPTFENSPRFSTKQPVAVQIDWLTPNGHQPVFDHTATVAQATASSPVTTKRTAISRAKRSWLYYLTFGLF